VPEKRRIQEPPIRVKRSSREAATRLANDLGVSYIDVIEWAMDALEKYYEHHGKRLLLPLRFNETFSITKIDPSKPLTLFEPPPSRVRSELVRREEHSKMKTRAR
jgi:hypothetical protein